MVRSPTGQLSVNCRIFAARRADAVGMATSISTRERPTFFISPMRLLPPAAGWHFINAIRPPRGGRDQGFLLLRGQSRQAGDDAMYFKDDYRLDVMTSTALVNKAPARFDWARYYSTFQKQSMSPRALAISVYHGYGFTPVWTTARREENFVSAGHLAFDFDAGDESSSLEYIRRVGTFAWMFASFGYTTASNTAAAPRCRVVFVLEYPITTPAEYRRVYQAVAWYISSDGSNTDPACKDPLRLYYGSKGAEVWDNWSLLGQGTIDYITETYAAAHPTMPASAKFTVPVSPTASMQDAKLASFGRAVKDAPLDAGHHTLLRIATTAGGYVASGALDRAAVVAELTAAAMTRPEPNPADIERAINDGLDYGAARPLQFEAARRVGDLLP